MLLPAVLAISVLASTACGETSGSMTMWSTADDVIVGGSCEYANAANGGTSSPAATSPYIASRSYCALDDLLYRGGAGCGNCFKVSSDGQGGTDPGRAGELVVQAVDSGSAKTFDCQLEAFKAIVGATTGVFPIKYEKVPCDVASGGPVATILDGDNTYYVKVVFSNLPYSVVSATMSIADAKYQMSRVSGATWSASTSAGKSGDITAAFGLKLDDGSQVSMENCFSRYPQPVKASCNGPATVSGTSSGVTLKVAVVAVLASFRIG